MSATTISTDLLNHLTSKHLPPTPTFLSTFVSSIRLTTPIPALRQSALFRILTTDITQSTTFTPASIFPRDIGDAKIRERIIKGPILCQVLDVEDIGSSRWSQVERMEAQERGEYTRGREIIRVVNEEDTGGPGQTQTQASSRSAQQQQPPNTRSQGPHKLLLQDASGVTVFALELEPVEKIGLDMNIGAKIVIRDVTVARGVLLLDPKCVEVLGGKIEELLRAWKEGRKERLMNAAGRDEDDG